MIPALLLIHELLGLVSLIANWLSYSCKTNYASAFFCERLMAILHKFNDYSDKEFANDPIDVYDWHGFF